MVAHAVLAGEEGQASLHRASLALPGGGEGRLERTGMRRSHA